MKQVWKVGSIFIAVVVLWISLLLTKDLPPSLQLIVPYVRFMSFPIPSCWMHLVWLCYVARGDFLQTEL